MSAWALTLVSAAIAVGLPVGVLVLRAPRARATVFVVAGLACGAIALVHDRPVVRGAYLVMALVMTFVAGYFWSRALRPRA